MADSCGQRSKHDPATWLEIQTKTLSSAITTLDIYSSLCVCACVCMCLCVYVCTHLMGVILRPGLGVSERWGPEQ